MKGAFDLKYKEADEEGWKGKRKTVSPGVNEAAEEGASHRPAYPRKV